MSGFSYSLPPGRINKLKGEILAHAVAIEVMGITGMQRDLPKNKGDTVVYRRYLPYGASAANFNTQNRPYADPLAHELQEGVTPSADTLVPQDVSVTLRQFGCLYQLTDKVADLYEDDVPAEMKKQCGERVSLVQEMVRYGVLKACTNVNYAGGSSRTAVSSKITLPLLRRVSRNLQANHAKRITAILAPAEDIKTSPIEASYLVFVHTDAESDVRDLAGFVPVAQYGTRKVVSQYELGSVENFRFITSPELAPYLAAGAAVGATGLVSIGGANVDVYPFILTGEDAWGQLALRGEDAIDPTFIPPGEKTKSDPLGQRGYVGAKFYMNAKLLNEGWMSIIEAGVTAL